MLVKRSCVHVFMCSVDMMCSKQSVKRLSARRFMGRDVTLCTACITHQWHGHIAIPMENVIMRSGKNTTCVLLSGWCLRLRGL